MEYCHNKFLFIDLEFINPLAAKAFFKNTDFRLRQFYVND